MTDTPRNLSINGPRLWQSLMDMAEIGATPKGGVCRLALTDLDRQGRDLFVEWCRGAGCSVRVDSIGNIFARRQGTDPDALPVATGSHLDTQPTGGKFDGIFGVLAGLEAIRTLNDLSIETRHPVEVCVWTNEEGARFPPAMMGSGVYAGVFDRDETCAIADHDGVTVGDALDAIGYRGDLPPGHQDFAAFFEAHIEQGPILEDAKTEIGIVTGVQGIMWYDLTVTGAEAHAGPTPMPLRRDALAAVGGLLPKIYAIAHDNAPHGRATIGEFRALPGSRNTIPGRVELTLDLRHPDADVLAAMDTALRQAVAGVALETGLDFDLSHVWTSAPIAFDVDCIQAVREAAAERDCSAMEIVSGAGHDAVYISRLSPTAMIFIPCEDGISHNEAENVAPADVERGATVLLNAILKRAM